MKRVAILLATYNGERWLSEQLDSLLNAHDMGAPSIQQYIDKQAA